MINIAWKENGKHRYENFLTDIFVDEFKEKLVERGCTDIVVTVVDEEEE